MYSIDTLLSDLSCGHEIEFTYIGEKYSISSDSNGWYLTKYGEKEYQSFENYNELVHGAKINNTLLREIWSNVQVNWVY